MIDARTFSPQLTARLPEVRANKPGQKGAVPIAKRQRKVGSKHIAGPLAQVPQMNCRMGLRHQSNQPLLDAQPVLQRYLRQFLLYERPFIELMLWKRRFGRKMR